MHDLTPRWPRWVLGRWSPPCCCRCWPPFYSISTRWGDPAAGRLYLDWYLKLWGDPRFLAAFGRSLLVCRHPAAGVVLVPPCWWWPTTSPGWIPG